MDNKNDFTQGSIVKKLLLFMIPILGSLILQAMYGAVDLLVVGRFGTTAGLSGVSTGGNILNLVTFVVIGISMGTTVKIGQYIGEDHHEKIGNLIGGTIALFSAISIFLCIVLLVFAKPIAVLMQAPSEALSLTVTYIRICGAGIFFIVAYNIISAIFRGLGDSRTPLLFVLIACIVNIIGDLFFVAVLHMNVAGAALATVMAQGVSVILSILIMRRKTLPFTFNLKQIGFNKEVKKILLIGTPVGLQEFLTQISFLFLCAFINHLGLDASSGYGVGSKIVAFVMLVPSSLMQSMASFVSQNVGAHKERRARKSAIVGACIGFSIGILAFIGVLFFGDVVSSLFTSDKAVIAKSWEYLKGFAPEAMVTSILFSYIGFFNGHSQTLFVMFQGIAQTFLVRLPVSYFMSIQPHASLTYIGYAAPLATVFGILINTIYYIHYSKQLDFE